MEYRIENGQVMATLNKDEVKELLNGVYWADNENEELNGNVNNELYATLLKVLNDLKNGNDIH